MEHGITELCYDVDLVELMLKQADAQLLGKRGIAAEELKTLQPSEPTGVAIEARVYAENPARVRIFEAFIPNSLVSLELSGNPGI